MKILVMRELENYYLYIRFIVQSEVTCNGVVPDWRIDKHEGGKKEKEGG